MLQEQITQYTAEINAFDTTNADELEQFRIRFLGTKGIIKDIFDEFKAVSPEEKRTLGKVLNEFKQLAETVAKQNLDKQAQAIKIIKNLGFIAEAGSNVTVTQNFY